ncbi:MAG: histidine kinase [Holophaga sp.]|nr:histidine kinase [Holophaga sp.]
MSFLMLVGHVGLAPLPWQWTGDDRPKAPPLRGLLQALPWNTLWLSALLGVVIMFFPFSDLRPAFHLHLFYFQILLRPQWGILLFNYPLALLFGWFLSDKESAEASVLEWRALADRTRAQALQAQLNPHVLFNVLSGLTELVHEDPEAAEQALVGLVEMYRQLMTHGQAARAPLARERALLNGYLGIEEIRLGSRLEVRWVWPPWADALELPPLLLQPLVENAIKHGIAPSLKGGTIRIEVTRQADRLQLTVANDGQPLNPAFSSGVGLGNLKERLVFLPELKPKLDLRQEGAWVFASLSLAWSWPA